jgi:hypothetical protein
MPTPTYTPIAKTVLTGTQADVTFSGISSTYTDLVLIVSSRSDASSTMTQLRITLNADNTTLYSSTVLGGYDTSAYSSRLSSTTILRQNLTTSGNTATSNTFGSAEFYFPNYAGSANKVISATALSETNSATGTEMDAFAGLYRNTSAVTSIKIDASGNNFVSGSRFDLYGISSS